MTKIYLFLFGFLLISLVSTKLNAQNIYFNFANDSNIMYSISEIRSITYTGNTININKINGTTNSYPLSNIESFNYNSFTKVEDMKISEYDEVLIYPNPSENNLTISYELEKPGKVAIEILGINGQQILNETIEHNASGLYNYYFNATDKSGNKLSSGIYFFNLTINSKLITKKIILTR